MIYIPFLYFTFLLLFILKKKKRFELSALITSAFLITSFFGIIIDYNQLYGTAGCVKAIIGIEPTLLYCMLATIAILPFLKLRPLKKNSLIPIRNISLLNMIVYFYMLIFLLVIYFFGKEIWNRLQSPDIGELRVAFAKGEDDLGFSNFSGIERILARLSFIFGSSAMFLQVIYFYSITCLNKSRRFNLSVLTISSLPILISMLSFDRSKIIYWLMSYIAIAVFFWPSLYLEHKKQIKRTFLVFSSILLVYLSIITIARYGSRDVGSMDSIIIYAGQSFNNFCLFYNKLQYDGIHLERIMPVLHTFISSFNEVAQPVRAFPIDTNVFASFSGHLIKEIGVLGTVIYCSIFFLVASFLFSKKSIYSITRVFIVIMLLYIPYLGIFGLFYSSIDRVVSTWIILIFSYFLRIKRNSKPKVNSLKDKLDAQNH